MCVASIYRPGGVYVLRWVHRSMYLGRLPWDHVLLWYRSSKHIFAPQIHGLLLYLWCGLM